MCDCYSFTSESLLFDLRYFQSLPLFQAVKVFTFTNSGIIISDLSSSLLCSQKPPDLLLQFTTTIYLQEIHSRHFIFLLQASFRQHRSVFSGFIHPGVMTSVSSVFLAMLLLGSRMHICIMHRGVSLMRSASDHRMRFLVQHPFVTSLT